MIIFKNKKLEIPVGLGPNFQEGSGEIINQNKTVDSSTFFQRVYPDPGFTGLGRVTINPYELDAKTVDSSTEIQVVTSDKDGLYRVVVNPYHLDTITIDSSTESQTVRGAYDEITVNPYTLDEKTVDSSSNIQIVTSDKDGLSKVTVRPYILDTLRVDSSTVAQTIEGAFGEVNVEPYVLDEKIVDSSTVLQVVHSDNDGLSQVTINPYALDEKTVNSSTNTQEITSDVDGLSKVVINPYTLDEKTVDSSTNPQVITSDEDGLRQVTIRPYVLSPLEVDSSTAMQEITGQYGTVKVNPYTLDEKTVDPSTNNVTVTSSKDGLSSVTVTPVTSSIDSNIAAGNIKKNVTILGVTGTFDGGTLQSKTVKSSTSKQTVTPSSGYYGLSSVVVNPYVLDSKTVKSSTSKQTVTSSKDGLSSVIVEPYVLDSKSVDPSTNSITVTSSKDGLSSVTVNHVTSSIDSNIKAGNIKKDVTILGVTGTYEGGGDPVPVPVEYISNEGDLNLVFNSGYTPNDTTKIIARIAWGGEGLGSWGNYFGVQNNFALREWGGYGSGEGQITFQTISTTCTVENVYTTPGDLSIVRNIEVGNNYVKADSSTASSAKYSGHISDHPMFIFGASDPGNGQLTEVSSRQMRIHSFAIYEGTTLIKNLVPFQDASLNGCFYDTVSETYIYPLQGTPTVGPIAIYQQKTVDPSLNAIEVTADAGFKALSKVTVNGVTAAVDPNITPGNIKAGVNILGVGGSFSGAIYHRSRYVANNSTEKKIFRNTGIIPTNNTRIEATVSFDDISTEQGGYGYLWGTTSGASFVVREFGGYGSRNVSYFDGNGIGYYSSDMSSAPRTYTHGQVEGDYSFMSYGGYIDKRSAWSHTWAAGDEIFIWAANKGNDTVDEYSSRVMRLYDFKIYEGDNLVFHGVPAADNDGACVLIDLVSNKMVEGEGTLTGGGVYVEPDEENYIENGNYVDASTRGSVYFNLGTNFYNLSDSSNVKQFIEIYASKPNSLQPAATLFGLDEDDDDYFGVTSINDSLGIAYAGGFSGGQTTVNNNIGGVHKYTLLSYYNNNPTYHGYKVALYVDGITVGVAGQSTLSPKNYDTFLFCENSWSIGGMGNPDNFCIAGTRVYQIRYYNTTDGEVHTLVPAYNNGQYCLKDLYNNSYIYAAAGTPTGHLKDRYLTDNGAINVYNG